MASNTVRTTMAGGPEENETGGEARPKALAVDGRTSVCRCHHGRWIFVDAAMREATQPDSKHPAPKQAIPALVRSHKLPLYLLSQHPIKPGKMNSTTATGDCNQRETASSTSAHLAPRLSISGEDNDMSTILALTCNYLCVDDMLNVQLVSKQLHRTLRRNGRGRSSIVCVATGDPQYAPRRVCE